MSFCLSAKLTKQGGITPSVEREGGDLACSASRIGGMVDTLTKVGGADMSLTKKGKISCAVYQVCTASIRIPYLEISPQIVWVLAGHTENEVYSNTKWHID